MLYGSERKGLPLYDKNSYENMLIYFPVFHEDVDTPLRNKIIVHNVR